MGYWIGKYEVTQAELCAFQGQTNVASAAQGSPNGAASQMPAYYDGELFTVNMFEVPASDPIIAHNSSANIIYATNDLDEEQDFVPVIDPSRATDSILCGYKSSSFLIRGSRPTSSSPTWKWRRPPPATIQKSLWS